MASNFYQQKYRTISVNASSSGDNALLSGVSGQSVKVIAMDVVAAAAVSAKLRSNTTDLHAALPLTANGNYWLPESPSGEVYFQTAAGEALNLNLSGAVAVTGWIKVVVE